MSAAEAERHQVRHGFALACPAAAPQSVKMPKPRQNKTEAEFGLILEAMKRRGELVNYQFEGITLRLADRCRYTPDFFIIVSVDPLRIRFAETKGAHIWDDSVVKFRVAREQNPWAEWELHQKNPEGWKRLL